MSFRDFDAARAERARASEPVRFRLGGEEFVCASQPTLADIFDLLDAPEAFDDGAPVAAGVRALTLFIERFIADDRSRKRWRKLLARKHDPIDGNTIVELGQWLTGEYSGRPTVPSTVSSDGRQPDTETSSGSRFEPVADSVT